MMTIKALEAASGLPRTTIRVYEARGLITPHESPSGNGYRLYDATHLEKLRTIRIAQMLGFSLKEIDALARLEEQGRLTPAESRVIVARKIAEIDAKLAEIRQLRDYLGEVQAWIDGGSVGPKPGFEARAHRGKRPSRRSAGGAASTFPA